MPYIATAKGFFDFDFPLKHKIDIDDIARSLTYTNRFNGHFGYLPVAAHSILVAALASEAAYKVPPQTAWAAGLLHDAHEAYLGDVSTPLKRVLSDPKFEELENGTIEAIMAEFGTTFYSVVQADRKALALEVLHLIPRARRQLFAPQIDKAALVTEDFATWDRCRRYYKMPDYELEERFRRMLENVHHQGTLGV